MGRARHMDGHRIVDVRENRLAPTHKEILVAQRIAHAVVGNECTYDEAVGWTHGARCDELASRNATEYAAARLAENRACEDVAREGQPVGLAMRSFKKWFEIADAIAARRKP